ncbi:MAG TPA: FAD binding domain-containing protein [Gaiellaceae bacterium]
MSAAYVAASTVDEALEAMAAGARPVAGGTDLVVGARQGKAPLPESLVAIHRLEELRGIEEADGGLHIGALTSHADLAAHPAVRERFTALADAAAIVGSHATRAFGTLGGNLMNASPAAETTGPLICFGATVTLRGPSGSRDVPVADLFDGPGSTTTESGELLVSVTVPAPADGTGSCYARLEYRRQMEIAVVGATAVVTGTEGNVTAAKVAITALAPTIRLVPEAEAALVGGGSAEQAATAAAAAAAPISDVRASADYRRAMAEVIARRTIEAALARARGEDVPIPASQSLYGGMS